jgi:leader peptidase (prepilin peptidase)/N-methyltransferase
VTIVETIELERHSARKTAGVELLCLLPSVLLGGAAISWGITRPDAADWYSRLLRWEPIAGWRPVTGLATAAMGFVVGGGIGWLVRLVGTFIIGKEALGTGDIHMMAAAGCVAGWPVVLIGFVLCSFLALVGWILILPFKRSRAIPLGPWLSISFLIVVLFHDPIMKSPTIQAVVDLVNLLVFKKPL